MSEFEVRSKEVKLEEVEEEIEVEEDEEDDSLIELGFIEEEINNLFLNKNWKNWDGGRIGGKPVKTTLLFLGRLTHFSLSFFSLFFSLFLSVKGLVKS